LDLNAVIWLEAYLKRLKKTLLLVSHDRDFLNYICTDTIFLHNQKLNAFKGNYDTFETLLKQQKKTQVKKSKQLEKDVKKMQTTKDSKVKQDRMKKIQKQGPVKKKEKEYSVKFFFPNPPPIGIPIIHIKDASFGYTPDNILFSKLDLNIDLKSRIAIVGPNGAGKSTLVNLILGELEATDGEIIRNRKLVTAKFNQHFVDQLEMTDTPVTHLQKYSDMKETEARGYLGKFGLSGQTHLQKIKLLSGGQKSRVVLATLSLKIPHIMFLDEPTNHLDIQSVDALAEALKAYDGGIVLISHDQRLISRVCQTLWVVKGDKRVTIYDGEFEDYKQELINSMPDELFDSDDDEK